jgi:hypothetical protein
MRKLPDNPDNNVRDQYISIPLIAVINNVNGNFPTV